jgi:hypothetical protein
VWGSAPRGPAAAKRGLLNRFERRVASFLGGFEAMLGLGQVLLELRAELLLALYRGLRLGAIELRCLSRHAFLGELMLKRRAFLARALVDPVCTFARGLGALLGVAGERVASLGVLPGASGFPLARERARLRFARLRAGLIALTLGGARTLERVIAMLLSLLRARQLACGSLLGLPGGGLSGRLRGDGSVRADDRVLRATLGILGKRLGGALSRLGVRGSLERSVLRLLRLRRGRQRCLGGLIGLEPLAAGGRLELRGA